MFQIDYRSRTPIYEQICDKVKEMIVLGILQDGEQIPTVRALAKDTGINPNTIQKAFSQLEREGIISRVLGKGSFVNMGKKEQLLLKNKALDDIRQTILKNKMYNISLDDVQMIVDDIFLQHDNLCEIE